MSFHARDIDGAWDKLGMVVKDAKDRRALFYYKNRLILTTKRSHGSGPLEGKIADFIRQQMKLSDTQFRELVACPLDLTGYIEILKKRGLITEE